MLLLLLIRKAIMAIDSYLACHHSSDDFAFCKVADTIERHHLLLSRTLTEKYLLFAQQQVAPVSFLVTSCHQGFHTLPSKIQILDIWGMALF